jgi:hypothetical protein
VLEADAERRHATARGGAASPAISISPLAAVAAVAEIARSNQPGWHMNSDTPGGRSFSMVSVRAGDQ